MAYPGGKNGAGVYQTLINLMPPHQVYIEPFLGGGAVMRLKRPARLSIGIDKDEQVIETWRPLATAGDAVPELRFQCGDGIRFLQRFKFTGQELVYCDPPYVKSTRTSGDLYRHEMTDAQHKILLATLHDLPCPVMVSGYWSELYAAGLAGWNSLSFPAMTRGGLRCEWVWFNFDPSALGLHDYQFLGKNFRERERIKRKKARWIARLSSMNLFERQALLLAIGEAWQLELASPRPASVDVDLEACTGGNGERIPTP